MPNAHRSRNNRFRTHDSKTCMMCQVGPKEARRKKLYRNSCGHRTKKRRKAGKVKKSVPAKGKA